ncbi:MAG: hypothetical protein UV82_C0009G0076 [Candidatus Magasanikbacteria bacterium GW2011_GWD2_43_18]|uniref:Uncharacterized protein n=1 Tax=Candidatus Magasanikbacteria bacterium GW2011_GWE2_42_7 TaxID=1619052 RepID=A0A0G1DLB0_9BACT|nr:MAG: hypothetical protein UV18_C0004G0159 [Candidatus Magasanikbacteria bacterium GW2011_GWC2_42_27]KKS71596.1 MAG: hypothetical protein UV42_C0024G0019 [Candidatus Magasanikbacteria bacterium GW2011_GWE2_42_7]KKT04336.1 MAG: hypothetical protein UV82_C0009G0076 [Candidatus Magasanikbacteria bacterium GW2011_GWD2_43_18]KKT25332.1 MAG: hypothetical protein UW10_C0009G0015 [Candidatus Magasanikbacteria bacterium GW2011_GWA2_43_9]
MTVREWVESSQDVYYTLLHEGYSLDFYRLVKEADLIKKLSIMERLRRRINTPFVKVSGLTFETTGNIDPRGILFLRARMKGLNPTYIHTSGKGWKSEDVAKQSDILATDPFKKGSPFTFYITRI